MIPLVIITAGTVINGMLTRKIPLIVGWLGAFAIQAFVRHWLWGVQLNTALSVMTGVAFVLFTNYMITDPGTTPFKAARPVHVRQRRRHGLRSADGLQRRLHVVLRRLHRLRRARARLVGCPPAPARAREARGHRPGGPGGAGTRTRRCQRERADRDRRHRLPLPGRRLTRRTVGERARRAPRLPPDPRRADAAGGLLLGRPVRTRPVLRAEGRGHRGLQLRPRAVSRSPAAPTAPPT